MKSAYSPQYRKQIIDTFPELEQNDKELSKEKDFIKNSNKFGK